MFQNLSLVVFSMSSLLSVNLSSFEGSGGFNMKGCNLVSSCGDSGRTHGSMFLLRSPKVQTASEWCKDECKIRSRCHLMRFNGLVQGSTRKGIGM